MDRLEQPLRIGLDGDILGRRRTGDESYLASLMRGLARVDRHNDYVVFVRDQQAVSAMFQGLDRFAFRRITPRSIWLRHTVGLPLMLRREPVDLLHVQYFAPPFAPCPILVTVHDVSFAVLPQLFTRRDRVLLQTLVPRSLRRADRVIVDVEHTKQDLIRTYDLDPARIAVIPLAADPQYGVLDAEACRRRISEKLGFDGPFVLYVGTLQPRKNVTTLIHAYSLFRERTSHPHKLVLVGKPKYRFQPVLDAIEASRFRDDIVLTGFVPEANLPAYYNAADVFVFPSLYEGFGLPVLEAMACGTPVITTNVSSLPEVGGDAALLVDPMDREAMGDALERVLGSEEVARQMIHRGLDQAAKFSWDQTARETLAVYQDVVREAQARRNRRLRRRD